MIIPVVISGTKSSIALRTTLAWVSSDESICTNGVVSPFSFQVMVGVGAPVEVHDIVTESPSTTVTTGSLLDVVFASTTLKCMQIIIQSEKNRYDEVTWISNNEI